MYEIDSLRIALDLKFSEDSVSCPRFVVKHNEID